MSTKNNGGPAFPVQESIMSGGDPVPAASGMSLRDWFAGQERLSDFDSPDVEYPRALAYALGGPAPEGGWSKDPVGMFIREARIRARMKYIRADEMLKAREQ